MVVGYFPVVMTKHHDQGNSYIERAYGRLESTTIMAGSMEAATGMILEK